MIDFSDLAILAESASGQDQGKADQRDRKVNALKQIYYFFPGSRDPIGPPCLHTANEANGTPIQFKIRYSAEFMQADKLTKR